MYEYCKTWSGLDWSGVDWICKTWSGFAKGGFVKDGFVRHGFVKGGFVKGKINLKLKRATVRFFFRADQIGNRAIKVKDCGT